MALREALLAGTTPLADGRQAEASPYEYTINAVEAGTLRRDRNLRAVTEARERGEGFERLPEHQDPHEMSPSPSGEPTPKRKTPALNGRQGRTRSVPNTSAVASAGRNQMR